MQNMYIKNGKTDTHVQDDDKQQCITQISQKQKQQKKKNKTGHILHQRHCKMNMKSLPENSVRVWFLIVNLVENYMLFNNVGVYMWGKHHVAGGTDALGFGHQVLLLSPTES